MSVKVSNILRNSRYRVNNNIGRNGRENLNWGRDEVLLKVIFKNTYNSHPCKDEDEYENDSGQL